MKKVKKVFTVMKKTLDKSIRKVGSIMSEAKIRVIAFTTYLALNFGTAPMTLFATENNAESSWNDVMDFILTWIPRLGGVLLFIGAIEFAIAYKNEDSNSKTNATRLMISGAMVIGVCVALGGLLKTDGGSGE